MWPAAYDHVFQGVLGQPAVQKHGDEQVPQGRPEYLWRRRIRGLVLGGAPPLRQGSPTVTMKGSVLIISRTKEMRKICSQMFPWAPWWQKRDTNQPGGQETGWGGQAGQEWGGGSEGRVRRGGGTHFVAEVNEEHGLQEAYYGHDDLGGAEPEWGEGQQAPPESRPHSPESPTESSFFPPKGWAPWGGREVSLGLLSPSPPGIW